MMSKLSTLIVDDELHGRENLRNLLDRHCPEVEIAGLASAATEAIPLIEQLRPDLVFLDILMPDKDGFALLDHFSDRNFAVIFVTASLDYGIRAVKSGVIDYLLKPLSIAELKAAVNKAVVYCRDQQREPAGLTKIALTHTHGFTIEDIANITWLQADDNYTRVYTVSGKHYLISRPLKDFERKLPEGIFLRTHKSFMINMHHLKDYKYTDGGTAVLHDGAKIPVSKRQYSNVLGALRKFSFIIK